jgi:predicted secreted protein
MSNAIPGSKVVLKRGDGATPEVFSEVAEVKGVTGPSMTSGVVDVTSFSSPDNYREFMATLKDPGQLTFMINFNPSLANHGLLKDDFDDQLVYKYKLEFPDADATTVVLPCILTGLEISAELEQAVQANVTLKITGAPIWS